MRTLTQFENKEVQLDAVNSELSGQFWIGLEGLVRNLHP